MGDVAQRVCMITVCPHGSSYHALLYRTAWSHTIYMQQGRPSTHCLQYCTWSSHGKMECTRMIGPGSKGCECSCRVLHCRASQVLLSSTFREANMQHATRCAMTSLPKAIAAPGQDSPPPRNRSRQRGRRKGVGALGRRAPSTHSLW